MPDDGILGSWRVAATITEPMTLTAHLLMTFVPGGGLIETRLLAKPPIPGVVEFATMETPGHGAWAPAGDGLYHITFVYLIQAADGGDLLATETGYWTATLTGPDTLSGPARSEVVLADGTQAVAWAGAAEGTRIRAVAA